MKERLKYLRKLQILFSWIYC